MAVANPVIFQWSEVADALFKARNIDSGLWRVGVGLRFAAANTGPNDGSMMPSGITAVESIVLINVDAPGPLVFDASRGQSSKVTSPRTAVKALRRKASAR